MGPILRRGRFRHPPGPAGSFLAGALAGALLAACAAGPDTQATATGPRLQVRGLEAGEPVVEARGLDALGSFAATRPEASDWQRLLSVHVVTGDTGSEAPPVLGTYQPDGDTLRFRPRWGLAAGLAYRARLDLSVLDPGGTAPPVALDFAIPATATEPTTTVTAVHPSADVLPENLLRFYIRFSGPMARGEAYDHVRLLDAAGVEVEAAFLELGEELWDPTGSRFTILFDPGRIKRGLLPREEVGPALVRGRSYTLEIDAGFRDADGLPLAAGHAMRFEVVAPIMTRIEPAAWSLRAPPPASREPLVVQFPRSLDHALLHRMLWVVDADGRELAGEVEVLERETRWEFTPDRTWRTGPYQLRIDTRLEDVSGNTVQGPFEEDVFGTGAARLEVETTSLRFRVGG